MSLVVCDRCPPVARGDAVRDYLRGSAAPATVRVGRMDLCHSHYTRLRVAVEQVGNAVYEHGLGFEDLYVAVANVPFDVLLAAYADAPGGAS